MIHPFSDGNGRTARLLMNLLLLRGGYPPIAVRPVDRGQYLAGLEHASIQGEAGTFHAFMHGRLDSTMSEYLAILTQ